jgi:hypothetical protein
MVSRVLLQSEARVARKKEIRMSSCLFSVNLALAVALVGAPAQDKGLKKPTAPESFRAQLNVTGGGGGAGAAYIDIKIDRYTPDADREAMATALKTGGYPALLEAVRKAPAVGTLTAGKDSFVIRWAREQRTGANKRTISVVTEKPVYFVGGGNVNAKPREGYELAVAQFDMDDSGLGKGTMAAAAKIKPGGPNGFIIDDYAEKPITLVSITRAY